MEEEKKFESRIYQSVEKYRDISSQKEFYSMQRLDLIVVSISSGSIFALLNFIKEIIQFKSICVSTCWYTSFLFFSLAIAFNIWSQIISHKSNLLEERWATNELAKLNRQQARNSIGENKNLERLIPKLNKASYWSLAIAFILSGILIALVIF